MHNMDGDSPRQRGKDSDQRLHICDWRKSACVVKMQIFFNKILKWNSSRSRPICLHMPRAWPTDERLAVNAVHALLCTLRWKMVASRSRRTDWLSLISLKGKPAGDKDMVDLTLYFWCTNYWSQAAASTISHVHENWLNWPFSKTST
jgi:hypothetical protein